MGYTLSSTETSIAFLDAGGIEQYVDFSRNGFWALSEADHNLITTPAKISVYIDDAVFILSSAAAIDIDSSASWDTITPTDYTTPANRAGKDFYIYAVKPATGSALEFKLSANSTYPDGSTAADSRKIGGFHCLCVDIGTLTYDYVNEGKDADYLAQWIPDTTIASGDTMHWLKTYVAGDILPFSIWDLKHKVHDGADQEGKVYNPKIDKWVGIYLASWDAGTAKLLSINGGTIADGTSTPKFHWYRFSQVLANQGEDMLDQCGFVASSLGAPQGVNINGAADPTTTAGHVATNTLRIVSNLGCEDITGVLWQWGKEGGHATDYSYTDAYDANDLNVGGQEYNNQTCPFFSCYWAGGVSCGSRSSRWNASGLTLNVSNGVRASAEPKRN